MNRLDFLRELERTLRARKVVDISEILQEYQQHFDFKLSEGFTEEEIAARLESPGAIAAQYEGETYQAATAPTRIGLGLLAVFAIMALIILYGLNIVFAGFSIALVCLGFCLVLNLNIASLIPAIPYLGRLLLAKQSKLCNVFFAKEFNQRFSAMGIKAYVVDPGLVNTEIGQELSVTNLHVLSVCPGGLPTTADSLEGIAAQGLWGNITTNRVELVAHRSISKVLEGNGVYVPGVVNRILGTMGAVVPRKIIAKLLHYRWARARNNRLRANNKTIISA